MIGPSALLPTNRKVPADPASSPSNANPSELGSVAPIVSPNTSATTDVISMIAAVILAIGFLIMNRF